MEITKQHKPNLYSLFSVTAGVAFVYLSIIVIGVGAAVAIPESILKPMVRFSPIIALSIVDLITIGIPVAICFFVFTWLFKLALKSINYYLFAAPYFLFMLYGLTNEGITNNDLTYYTAITVAKIIPVLLCVILLSKSVKGGNGA